MREIVIAGGGIVGVALAAECAARGMGRVTVLDQGPRQSLAGSTGHAPGYVGVYNELAVLIELARLSIAKYEGLVIDGLEGFSVVGSLELAQNEAELLVVRRRGASAAAAGMTMSLVTAEQAAEVAPHLVPTRECAGGVHYPADGTARADVITAALRKRAEDSGAEFRYDTAVTAVDVSGDRIRGVRTSDATIAADDLVIAAGVWGPKVAALVGCELPLTPVAHPYVYGPLNRSARKATPFIRWPVKHVYVRDHGERLGIGTYDHVPVPVSQEDLGTRADRGWLDELFDPAIEQALKLLPDEHRFPPVEKLNGVFSMTADNLPLVGPSPGIQGLWFAEAIWVTHAAGAASVLASWMAGEELGRQFLTLRPDRFGAESQEHCDHAHCGCTGISIADRQLPIWPRAA